MAMMRIFWGFCRKWFLIDPLHYLSSRSDFGFEFAEIFIIEKRLPDSAIRRVGESANLRLSESGSRWLADSGSRWLADSGSRGVGFWMFKRKLGESESRRLRPTRQVGESLTPRLSESESRRLPASASQGVAMESLFEFFKIFHQITAL